ncbi:quinolinate synthase NadA [Desulfovibrio litoralis]|uniref:Quinolinate synthase n=1 Tax=Desulfovibrio litoralis DSM 11393 TaxID=1121455 RepID=A0A1M7RUV0_9BACT|nr:quinolinate synthase NadA [Desulfovibrio litoralis]SHN49954.1 quinolinate synthetase [Desulfovibrio litoralis DSM 11393]
MNITQEKISKIRQELKKDLFIVGHHYQNDEVIRHVDLRGDSLELARKVSDNNAKYIVFCGVYFMAESAALLAEKEQKVFLPDKTANCVMSQMAPAQLLDTVISKLKAKGRKIIPLAYVNTSVAVKAVCGKHGGAVCTSANAKTMLKWALKQGDGVLFLPDKNLARNTAKDLQLPELEQRIIDIRNNGNNLEISELNKFNLLIWPGCCAIHARFNTEQIEKIRKNNINAKIIVHPECSPELVNLADASGSTSFLIKYVAELPKGSEVFIGTEWNLVKRLAEQYKGIIQVKPLIQSSCSHMNKINEEKLLAVLERLQKATPDELEKMAIQVPELLREDAKNSLLRMLEACSENA